MFRKMFNDAGELQRLRAAAALMVLWSFSFAAAGQSAGQPDIRHLLDRAQQGYIKDEIQLAHAFESGSGVAPDNAEAAHWFMKAANQGDLFAQTYVAHLFLQGKGVTQSPEQAFQWYQRAAVENYSPAQKSTMRSLCLTAPPGFPTRLKF